MTAKSRTSIVQQQAEQMQAARKIMAAGVPSAHESTPQPPRAKPVRITADLTPVQFRWLKGWLVEAADEAGIAEVKGVEVIRALLDQQRDDPALAACVRAAIVDKRR